MTLDEYMDGAEVARITALGFAQTAQTKQALTITKLEAFQVSVQPVGSLVSSVGTFQNATNSLLGELGESVYESWTGAPAVRSAIDGLPSPGGGFGGGDVPQYVTDILAAQGAASDCVTAVDGFLTQAQAMQSASTSALPLAQALAAEADAVFDEDVPGTLDAMVDDLSIGPSTTESPPQDMSAKWEALLAWRVAGFDADVALLDVNQAQAKADVQVVVASNAEAQYNANPTLSNAEALADANDALDAANDALATSQSIYSDAQGLFVDTGNTYSLTPHGTALMTAFVQYADPKVAWWYAGNVVAMVHDLASNIWPDGVASDFMEQSALLNLNTMAASIPDAAPSTNGLDDELSVVQANLSQAQAALNALDPNVVLSNLNDAKAALDASPEAQAEQDAQDALRSAEQLAADALDAKAALDAAKASLDARPDFQPFLDVYAAAQAAYDAISNADELIADVQEAQDALDAATEVLLASAAWQEYQQALDDAQSVFDAQAAVDLAQDQYDAVAGTIALAAEVSTDWATATSAVRSLLQSPPSGVSTYGSYAATLATTVNEQVQAFVAAVAPGDVSAFWDQATNRLTTAVSVVSLMDGQQDAANAGWSSLVASLQATQAANWTSTAWFLSLDTPDGGASSVYCAALLAALVAVDLDDGLIDDVQAASVALIAGWTGAVDYAEDALPTRVNAMSVLGSLAAGQLPGLESDIADAAQARLDMQAAAQETLSSVQLLVSTAASLIDAGETMQSDAARSQTIVDAVAADVSTWSQWI